MDHTYTAANSVHAPRHQDGSVDVVYPLPKNGGIFINPAIVRVPLGELVEVRPRLNLITTVREDPAGSHRLIGLSDAPREDTSFAIGDKTGLRFTPQSSGAVSGTYDLREGDLLLQQQEYSSSSASPHRVFVITSCVPGTIARSQFLILRRRDERVSARYLAWFLNAADTQRELKCLQQGSSFLLLDRTMVQRLVVPLPPSAVQETIVGLDAAQEEQIACQRHLIGLLQQRRRGITQHLLNAKPSPVTENP